ncbi:hypothetical protein AMJ48_01060 [Parcubacteria bacterium DG_74_1]|nr:MAG: hypothetical protein AMJ48_01060 [Parcubacteria bacterium DG_74_1]
MKTLKDFHFKGKKVLVRCDFNVPLDERGNILDDFRIRQTVPTIEYLIKKGARIIILSRLGRPLEKPPAERKKYSSKIIIPRLEKLLKKKVKFLPNNILSKKVERETGKLRPGEIIVLENIRLYKGEVKNNLQFAKKVANLGEIYINEAFGEFHRKLASIVSIPKYLRSGIGFLAEKEIKVLTNLIKKPQKPLIAIVGGAKVETKTKLIDKISEMAKFVLIGDLIKKEIEEKKIKLKNPQKIIAPIGNINAFDIDRRTANLFKEKIKLAKTIFWNGPLGKIEEKPFQKGSKAIAKAIIESDNLSVIGGGETVEFINKLGLTEEFDHVSTGGGAMLDFIVDGELVGIEALK